MNHAYHRTAARHDGASPPQDGLDADALGGLYQQHWPSVYGFLRRRMVGAPDAEVEDVTALVFERICRYAPRYCERGRLTAWIYQVARTVQVDQHRRARSTVELLEVDASATADAGGALQVALLDVAAAWRLLPRRQQIVLTERLVYERSHAEAGLVLGVGERASKKLQRRALATLRHLLDGPQMSMEDRP